MRPSGRPFSVVILPGKEAEAFFGVLTGPDRPRLGLEIPEILPLLSQLDIRRPLTGSFEKGDSGTAARVVSRPPPVLIALGIGDVPEVEVAIVQAVAVAMIDDESRLHPQD